MKDLYTENYQRLMKEVEKDTNKWKDILCSCVGRITILKMSTLSIAIYRFNTILVKIPMTFLTEAELTILNIYETTKQ